ncbi:PadR family transcriptional regulator [Paenibacillus sp. HMSSN-139]|nr:PadR family transcriptional regulator [Paenibacillus sp. HMSSN-139]
MSINYAILGMLSARSLTGYDLKKIIQDSPFMPWSGNNNQIYKALVELLEEGWVTNEVHHQDSAPSKKIYTITDAGREELKAWVLSPPELPEFKNTFLVRLAWADSLGSSELNTLLTGYEQEIYLQIAAEEEKQRRGEFSPRRTPREAYLWDQIHGRVLEQYRSELDWIRQLREDLGIRHTKEGEKPVNYQLVEKTIKTIVVVTSAEPPIATGKDAIRLIEACIEHNAGLLAVHAEALSEDFFKLRTGVAGEILQKFVNFSLRAAIVAADGSLIKGRMKELLAESNRGNAFRVFATQAEAENWLAGS